MSTPTLAPTGLIGPATRRARDAAVLALIAAAGVAVAIAPFATGLLSALALSVITGPSYRWLAARVKPAVAGGLVLLGVAALFVLPAWWLVSRFVDQLPRAVSALRAPPAAARLDALLAAGSGGQVDAGQALSRATAAAASWVSALARTLAGGAARGALDASICLMTLYYLLLGGPALWPAVRRQLPFSEPTADALGVHLSDVTRGTVAGSTLSAVLQGASIGVGLHAAGIPDALFWGVVGGFATVVPVIGNALVWGPAAIGLALEGRVGATLIVLLTGGVVPATIDRVVRAVVSQRMGSVPPLVTLLGTVAGVRYFGVAGVVLGPLALSSALELIRAYERDYGLAPPAPAGDGVRAPSS